MENTKAKQVNVNLYTKYKMFSWDLLFYYAIIFLFFTQTKGISAADVLLAESFYPLFKIIFLVPATVLINALGKRKSLIIGNGFVFLSIFTYIVGNNFAFIVVGELLSAIGFIIKGICESNMIYDSLESNSTRGTRFSEIEGKGTSYYYYVEGISAIIAGFLFAVNGYIPMFLCLGVTIYATYLSTKFRNIDEKQKINIYGVHKEVKDLFNSFRLFGRSPRLKNLIFFGALISAVILSLTMLRSSIMQDVGISSEYFGIIFAVLGLISGIAAKNEFRVHKKFRNKTLASLALPLVFSCIILGVVCQLSSNFVLNVSIVLIMFLIQYIVRGPFYPLIKQYLNNFTTVSLRNKISSSFNLLENILRFAITFIASALLRITTTANTFTVLGCLLAVVVILMLDNMKTKVGLRPDQYSARDKNILELK